jgi:protein-tyrosine-phosphatase
MSAKHILFVCTGNSCRSVMAKGLMEQVLRRAGSDTVKVDSAGVFAIDGMAPTRETQRVLQDIGVDCSGHRARALTFEMIEAAELIFVMEEFQMEEVLRRAPSARDKVHLLKPYGLTRMESDVKKGVSPNIPDPIGKPLEVYEVCFSEIREAIERVARLLGVHTA